MVLMKKIVLTGLMTTLLLADFTMTYEMDSGLDGKLYEVIEYKDANHVKLSFYKKEDQNSTNAEGQYLIDGRHYTVLKENGQLTYMDMDKIDGATSKLEDELNVSREQNAPEEKPFFTILNRGAPQVVSGIRGEVWEVESEEDGRRYKEEIVVTNNRDVVDAMKISFDILKQFGEGPYGMEIDHDMESMMLVTDGYALLLAEGIRFVKLSSEELPDNLFVLPKDAVDGMKNLPEIDEAQKDAGKRILKSMLE